MTEGARLTINNNDTTETEPDVVMPRDLAEWLLNLVPMGADFFKKYDVRRRGDD